MIQQPKMSMAQAAKQLAMQGRGGDSTLVHMRPDEVSAMQNMAQQAGTSMTVNPSTGLPEAFNLRKLFNINTYTDPIERGMKSAGLGGLYDSLSGAARTVGENAQYILPFVPGAAFANVGLQALASPMGRGLLGGAIGTMAGGRPNLKRGLFTGLTSYGLSSAFQGLQAAGGGTGAELEPTTRAAGLSTPPGAAAETPSLQTIAPPPIKSEAEAAYQGIQNLMSSDKGVSTAASKAMGQHFNFGKGYATMMGITGTMELDQQEQQLEADRAAGKIAEAQYQAQKIRIANARRRAEEAMRANPYQFEAGGTVPLLQKGPPEMEQNLYGMAKGGVPRYIDGPGDGMSDSVPASIDGMQPAALADGEFVIPADVVSHLGNGSTKAGASQLYEMMDRIRQARTGNKQQGREIEPNKYLPA